MRVTLVLHLVTKVCHVYLKYKERHNNEQNLNHIVIYQLPLFI
jgi:hypothetical protein